MLLFVESMLWSIIGDSGFVVSSVVPSAQALLSFHILGIYTKRDRVQSIAYSEELISATNSATLQSTDRHHGIVDQKRSHLQRDS